MVLLTMAVLCSSTTVLLLTLKDTLLKNLL